jgi:hypothetical protein
VLHVPAAKNTNATIDVLLETLSSTRSVQSCYKENNSGDPVSCWLSVDRELVENSVVKRRLGGWFEMAASLGPS